MKKKFKPTKRHFATQKEVFSFPTSLQKITQVYRDTMKKLTPLIIKDQIQPMAAAVLVALYSDAVIVGKENSKEHSMEEPDLLNATNLLLQLWKQGTLQPPAEYPYTLEETLQKEHGE